MPAIRPCDAVPAFTDAAASTENTDEHLTEPATELDDLAAGTFARMVAEPARRARLRDELIESGLPLATRLARHYQGRGEPLEDLIQVATLGLIKAIDGYDPERGPFSHYAGPTIRGELKKHFRDRGWSIRVPRRLQELKMDVSRAHQALAHELSRAPTVADLAKYLRVDEEHVIEGMDLSHAYQPVSLDAPASGQDDAADLGALLGARDPAMESVDDRMTLAGLLPELPEREQRILHLRFSGNLTQSQIAAEIGISQMHVSRLLSQTLTWLRTAMTMDAVPDPADAPALPPPANGSLRICAQRVPGGTVVVRVRGEVDHDNAEHLRTALCEAALSDRPREVRVDLGGVSFLDATGVAALLSGRSAARHGGAGFHLDEVRPPTAELLRNAGVADAFGLGGTPAAARPPEPAGIRPAARQVTRRPAPRHRPVTASPASPTPPSPAQPASSPTATRTGKRSAARGR